MKKSVKSLLVFALVAVMVFLPLSTGAKRILRVQNCSMQSMKAICGSILSERMKWTFPITHSLRILKNLPL